MRILVIAAHPDDEILGVGGTICKYIENGDEVFVCIVTKAIEPIWSKEYMERKIIEQKEVDNLLGIKERLNLDYPTTQINVIPQGEFNSKISNIINKINPDIIFTHYENDLNLDHQLVYKATIVATRPPKKIRILSYETPSSTEYSSIQFKPNFYIDITKFIQEKIDAFNIYKSEVKLSPHSRSLEGIKILAQKRGSEICSEFAEAFILIRDYWI